MARLKIAMTKACPIDTDVIDERVVRTTALLILPLLFLALWQHSPWIALLVAADFGLRGGGLRRLSPLARLARIIVSVAGGTVVMVNTGPKRFAAKIGFVFSVLVAATLAAHLVTPAWIVGGALGACAALEGFLGLCVGCRIYQFLPHRTPQPQRP